MNHIARAIGASVVLVASCALGCAESHEPYRVIDTTGVLPVETPLPDALMERCLTEGHVLYVSPRPGCASYTVPGVGDASEGPLGDVGGTPVRIVVPDDDAFSISFGFECTTDTQKPITVWMLDYPGTCGPSDTLNSACRPGAPHSLPLHEISLPPGRTTLELMVQGEGTRVTITACLD
jgi:hypothetical protein